MFIELNQPELEESGVREDVLLLDRFDPLFFDISFLIFLLAFLILSLNDATWLDCFLKAWVDYLYFVKSKFTLNLLKDPGLSFVLKYGFSFWEWLLSRFDKILAILFRYDFSFRL